MAVTAACSVMMMAGCSGNNERQDNMETLGLTQEWDKVFPESDKVEHSKAVFRNRYGITLAEMGFMTIAFDPSYTGESGGEPRYVASPDINTEA